MRELLSPAPSLKWLHAAVHPNFRKPKGRWELQPRFVLRAYAGGQRIGTASRPGQVFTVLDPSTIRFVELPVYRWRWP